MVEIEIDKPVGKCSGRPRQLTMKATDMETVYDLGTKMIEAISKAKVNAGDVINIDKAAGASQSLDGRFQIERLDAMGGSRSSRRLPGGLQKRRRRCTPCLCEIDVINSRTQGFLALFAGDTGEIRRGVDRRQQGFRVEEEG